MPTFGFNQVGATCHTTEAPLDVMRPVIEDRIISRIVDVVWLRRGCDLIPLHYYLWGAVKDKFYGIHIHEYSVFFFKYFPKQKTVFGEPYRNSE